MTFEDGFISKTDAISVNMCFANAGEYAKKSNFAPYGYICICVKDDGMPYSEDYVVFWANTSSPNKEIVCEGDDGEDPYAERFTLNLDILPNGVREVLFCVRRYLTDESDFVVDLYSGKEKILHSCITNKFGWYVKPETVLVLKLIKEEKWRAVFFCDEIDIFALLE